jgi:Lrp/AsnC family leucine-responsive transcriptional regulator
MLYSLQKERKIVNMALQSERPLDSTDWKILRELQQDARLSSNELGKRVGLSAPATAERVRKLETAGMITGYSVQIDPAKLGMPLLALILLRCNHGSCLLRTSTLEEFPEVLEMHKLSGSYCAVLKVALASMPHLEAFNHRLSTHGALVVHLITSSVLPHRILDWEQFEANFDLPSYPGWSKV